jgi:hypothetical protein
MRRVAEASLPAARATMVTLNVPATVGVPEINPVVGFSCSPGGSGFASKLVGLWLAVIW